MNGFVHPDQEYEQYECCRDNDEIETKTCPKGWLRGVCGFDFRHFSFPFRDEDNEKYVKCKLKEIEITNGISGTKC
jgi:hypothetical protein